MSEQRGDFGHSQNREIFSSFPILKASQCWTAQHFDNNNSLAALLWLVLLSSRGKCSLSFSLFLDRVGSTVYLSIKQIHLIIDGEQLYVCTQ